MPFISTKKATTKHGNTLFNTFKLIRMNNSFVNVP